MSFARILKNGENKDNSALPSLFSDTDYFPLSRHKILGSKEGQPKNIAVTINISYFILVIDALRYISSRVRISLAQLSLKALGVIKTSILSSVK